MTDSVPAHMAHLNKELELLYNDLAGRDIDNFRALEFDLHTGIRRSVGGSQREGAGGLLIDFLSAVGSSPFEDFVADYRHNPAVIQTIETDELEDIAESARIAHHSKAYALSKAYQKRAWQDVCGASFSIGQMIAVNFRLFEAQGDKYETDSELYKELLDNVLYAEAANKYFQLHMILEAPVEAIRYTWSRESQDDVALYAPLLRKFAAVRNDAAITAVIDSLTGKPPAAVKKAKKTPAPKR